MARNNLSNLGILPLQLWYGGLIGSELTREFYLGPDCKSRKATDYMMAISWAGLVCEEDPALEHIVKRAVCCIVEVVC
jgi:hypothetical protein